MELIENSEVDPRWEDSLHPDSGRIVARSSDTRWAAVHMGFNWRLVGLEKNGCYSFGWCYRNRRAILAAVAVWDPDVQDEPLGWRKRAGGMRRAPRREEDPQYNRARCVHGTYVDATFCERVRVCASFPGVFRPAEGNG